MRQSIPRNHGNHLSSEMSEVHPLVETRSLEQDYDRSYLVIAFASLS